MAVAVNTVISAHMNLSQEISGNFELDTAVLSCFPVGCRVVSAHSYGSSAWARTARITTVHADGFPYRYFLKLVNGPTGRAIAEGEFHSMTAIFKTCPSFAPQPIAWGQCSASSSPPTYFYLSEFKDMSQQLLPDPLKLGIALAALHHDSVSPAGQFGFHITTCHGKFPQNVAWNDSWMSFFSALLIDSARIDANQNGAWPELDKMVERTTTQVLPLLLGPLESHGRKVKPCLIHGDLWEGNVETVYETQEVVIFDAAAYYAHNEMEIAIWRTKRSHLRGRVFQREYLRNFGISEPVEQFEDRGKLYAVRLNLMHSALYGDKGVRMSAYEDLSELLMKYAPLEGDSSEQETEGPRKREFPQC